jgi:hypothetical protein
LLENGPANTSVARKWLGKRLVTVHAYVRNNRRTVGGGVFCAVRAEDIYNSDLAAMRSSCEIGTNQRGPEPWNTEAEESMTLEAVTRRQPVKTQPTEENQCVLCAS